MRRSLIIAAVILGAIAAGAMAGALRLLPAHLAFVVGAPAILLCPGALLAAADARTWGSRSLPETLALWLALGAGTLSVAGLVGLALKTTVSVLSMALAVAFGCATIWAGAKLILRPRADMKVDTTAAPPRIGRPTLIFILALAAACGLMTLVTPRDVDDWYYLAYIRDFVSDHAIRSEDAILGPAQPASPRIWYASWWVAEAIISRATGADPVATHQIYLPLFLAPFTVLAAFALARQVFQDHRAAAIGASLQTLFYVSSAYPYNSAGWVVFCRIAQDKAVACFIMVPVAAALGLRFLSLRLVNHQSAWRALALYLAALVSALLVHPLSVVWVGVILVPFAVIETLRPRRRAALNTLAALALPLVASGLLLAAGMADVSSELETKAARQTEDFRQAPESDASAPFKRMRSQRQQAAEIEADQQDQLDLHMPGDELPWASEEGKYSTVLRRRAEPVAANPLYVTRYPLALVGLALTLLLVRWARRDAAARLLLAATLAILVFAFVPPCAALTAKALTWKLVYRLSWVLPWGLTIAFFLVRIRLWRLPSWVIAAVLALALARGNPANYVKGLLPWTPLLRPSSEAAEVLGALVGQPAPQGVVIASQGLSRMVPGFAADAYPATYRGSGALTLAEYEAISGSSSLTDEATATIARSGAKYVLIEKVVPLGRALAGARGFELLKDNPRYQLWKIIAP